MYMYIYLLFIFNTCIKHSGGIAFLITITNAIEKKNCGFVRQRLRLCILIPYDIFLLAISAASCGTVSWAISLRLYFDFGETRLTVTEIQLGRI